MTIFYLRPIPLPSTQQVDDVAYLLKKGRVERSMLTVGAQSIAPAQSIAHGQIGTVSVKKTKFLKNFFLQNIKNGKFSSRFLNKISQF